MSRLVQRRLNEDSASVSVLDIVMEGWKRVSMQERKTRSRSEERLGPSMYTFSKLILVGVKMYGPSNESLHSKNSSGDMLQSAHCANDEDV